MPKRRCGALTFSLWQVKTLFQGLDSTGDGAINLEEFSKLVKSDKLAFLCPHIFKHIVYRLTYI